MANVTHTFSDDITYAQKASAKAQQQRMLNTVAIAFMGFALALIPGLAGVEYTLTFSVMDMLFGAEVPNDPVPFQVYVLSGSAMVAVVALHVFIEKHPKHLAVRLIEKAAPFGLLLFFAGMIALFASTDFHGLDAGSDIPFSDAELFGDDPAIGASPGGASPWLDMLIGIGLGSLIIVNVAVIHRLIGLVRDKLPKLLDERARLTGIVRMAKRVLHRGKAGVDAKREIERRRAVTAADLALETTADIEAAIDPTMRKLSKMAIAAMNFEISFGSGAAVFLPTHLSRKKSRSSSQRWKLKSTACRPSSPSTSSNLEYGVV